MSKATAAAKFRAFPRAGTIVVPVALTDHDLVDAAFQCGQRLRGYAAEIGKRQGSRDEDATSRIWRMVDPDVKKREMNKGHSLELINRRRTMRAAWDKMDEAERLVMFGGVAP